MGRREQNKEDKRARIALAARALFEARGFDGTTVRDIAARAGVGTGTVLLYAGSKADLLFELFVDELEEVIGERTATLDPGADLVDQWTHLFGGLLDRYAAHPDLSRVYVKETLFLVSSQASRYEQVTFRFLGQIADGVVRQRDALVPGVDPGTLAAAAFGLYLQHVALLLRTDTPDPGAAQALLRVVLDSLIRPLRRPVAAP